jgi:hypothetical protein
VSWLHAHGRVADIAYDDVGMDLVSIVKWIRYVLEEVQYVLHAPFSGIIVKIPRAEKSDEYGAALWTFVAFC